MGFTLNKIHSYEHSSSCLWSDQAQFGAVDQYFESEILEVETPIAKHILKIDKHRGAYSNLRLVILLFSWMERINIYVPLSFRSSSLTWQLMHNNLWASHKDLK